jgi:hypothetical protein
MIKDAAISLLLAIPSNFHVLVVEELLLHILARVISPSEAWKHPQN